MSYLGKLSKHGGSHVIVIDPGYVEAFLNEEEIELGDILWFDPRRISP